MRPNLYRLLFLFSVFLGTASAGAAVTVTFTKPESYTDMGRDEPSRGMKEIEAHLKQLGERYLPPHQSLKIEVLDIDLAGHVNFSSRLSSEVRVLRGKADWPSIKLRYVLEADGRVLLEQQEHVADMDYLQRPGGAYAGQFLQYEKRMLDSWFRQRFASQKR